MSPKLKLSNENFTIKELHVLISQEMGYAPNSPLLPVISDASGSLGIADQCNRCVDLKEKAKLILKSLGRLNSNVAVLLSSGPAHTMTMTMKALHDRIVQELGYDLSKPTYLVISEASEYTATKCRSICNRSIIKSSSKNIITTGYRSRSRSRSS